jgi:hypothetical protein
MPNRHRTRALIFVTVAAIACARGSAETFALPSVFERPGAPVSLLSPAGDTVQGLRNAILSVHAFVEKRKLPYKNLMANVETMPLPDAAKLIREDTSRLRPLRIQTAITRLLTHARSEPEARAAIQVLVGDQKTAELVTKVDEAAHGAPDGIVIEQVVAPIVAATLGPIQVGTCTEWTGASNVDWAGSGNDISVVVNGKAKQKIAKARLGLDPQSWTCSELWTETYLAEMSGGQPVPDPINPHKPKKATPQPLGQPYDGTLYEHFTCTPAFPCDVELLLEIGTLQLNSGDTYYVTYQRPRPLPGTVNILVDRGWIQADADGPNRVVVGSFKVFGFEDPAVASAIMLALQSIDMSYYFSQLVCCQ